MKRYIAGAGAAFAIVLSIGVTNAAENTAETGQAIYKRANCVGCHKWHGGGGGGYGGAALSLRKTELDKDQVMETVKCGRPGTGMPYFLKESYPADHSQPPQCFGMTWMDLESMPLAQGGVFLKPDEIEAVADYVVTHIKGKGDPDLADCTAFFGEGSSACEVFKKGGHHAMPTPATTD
jgi:mono/diheme cytochrome c family protein